MRVSYVRDDISTCIERPCVGVVREVWRKCMCGEAVWVSSLRYDIHMWRGGVWVSCRLLGATPAWLVQSTFGWYVF